MAPRYSSPIQPSPSRLSETSSLGVSPLHCVYKPSDIIAQIMNEDETVRFQCLAFKGTKRCHTDTRGFGLEYHGLAKRVQAIMCKQDVTDIDDFKLLIRMLFCSTHRVSSPFARYFDTFRLHWKGGRDQEEVSLLNAIREYIYPAQRNGDTPNGSPNPGATPASSSEQVEYIASGASVRRKLDFSLPARLRDMRSQNSPFNTGAGSHRPQDVHIQPPRESLRQSPSGAAQNDDSREVDLDYTRDMEAEQGGASTWSGKTLQLSPTSSISSQRPSNSHSQETPSSLADESCLLSDGSTQTPSTPFAGHKTSDRRASLNGQSTIDQQIHHPQIGVAGGSVSRAIPGKQRQKARNIPLASGSMDDTFLPQTTCSEATGFKDHPKLDPSKISPSHIDLGIFKEVRRTIEHDNAGGVYILCAPKYTESNYGRQLLKIGKAVDIDSRMKGLKRKCEMFDLEQIGGVSFVPWHTKLERLVHAELHNYCRRFKCSSSTCQTVHREWHDVTKEEADKSIQRWAKFLNQKPYDRHGVLLDYWSNRTGDENINPPENSEKWDHFGSHSLRWDIWLQHGIEGWETIQSARKNR
ncbi:hypothetical protein OIDMADRAFT_181188 [Oidiodendron maius Zn]|uniref:Bacteriophage T5 Orf172 DNA-binding domain-containing protein n=1 Tax=Oidiodendron maius (strain Zn) TaxID=913774 RepID=A0A0C3CLF7_OIDMZ|nr:hypothetical protein OIDMADRAFT_181188 [Oidiodendron maius Zn]